MLGIKDPWIWAAYVLCILSTLMCVVYGIIYWNKGDDSMPKKEDKVWAKEEDEITGQL